MKKIGMFFLSLAVNHLIAQPLMTVKEAGEIIVELYKLKLLSKETQKMFLQKLENKSSQEPTSTKSQLFESASLWENHLIEKKERYKKRSMRKEEAYGISDSSAYESIGSYWINFKNIQKENGLWGSGFRMSDYNKMLSKNFSKKELKILQKLLLKAIINEQEYRRIIESFEENYDGNLPGEFLGKIYEMLYYFENYDKLKKEQIEYLTELKDKNGWLSEENYQKLITSYQPY